MSRDPTITKRSRDYRRRKRLGLVPVTVDVRHGQEDEIRDLAAKLVDDTEPKKEDD